MPPSLVSCGEGERGKLSDTKDNGNGNGHHFQSSVFCIIDRASVFPSFSRPMPTVSLRDVIHLLNEIALWRVRTAPRRFHRTHWRALSCLSPFRESSHLTNSLARSHVTVEAFLCFNVRSRWPSTFLKCPRSLCRGGRVSAPARASPP